MSKLNEWVVIHFKEDGIDGLRAGELTDDSKQAIKDIFLEIVGEDEPMKTLREDKWAGSAPFKRNQLRTELRKKIEEL